MSATTKIEGVLPDWVLCLIYSAWSEEQWAAAWMSDHENSPAFVAWLREQMSRLLEDYERHGTPAIREAVRQAAITQLRDEVAALWAWSDEGRRVP
jgi:hypothetical protein